MRLSQKRTWKRGIIDSKVVNVTNQKFYHKISTHYKYILPTYKELPNLQFFTLYYLYLYFYQIISAI